MIDYTDSAFLRELNKKAKKGESTSLTEAILGFVFVVLFLGVVGVPLFIYMVWSMAYVGTIMWAWFVVPIFGLAPLTMGQAWGLSMVISMWTYQHHPWKGEDTRQTSAKAAEVVMLLARPWLILLFGWICHRWYMPVVG